jgi:acyl dehydratase
VEIHAPIKIGDTLHARARMWRSRTATSRVGAGDDGFQVLNQLGEVVQEGATEHLVARRLG